MVAETPLSLASQALLEIALFYTNQPSLDQIVSFHASSALTEQVYALIAAEKAGTATDEDRRDLDTVEALQHIIIQAKGEALKKLKQKAA